LIVPVAHGPATVREPAGAILIRPARSLHHAIERDECGDFELSHDYILLMRRGVPAFLLAYAVLPAAFCPPLSTAARKLSTSTGRSAAGLTPWFYFGMTCSVASGTVCAVVSAALRNVAVLLRP